MVRIISIFFCLLVIQFSKAQVGIGTNKPASSAQLEISSTNKGFLPPRMTLAQRNLISNPVAGLVIWCSDCDELQVYNGYIWKNMSGTVASDVATAFPTIKICNQTWMYKNLDKVTYNNGDPIPQVTDSTEWANLTTGAWCWYNNDSASYAAVYGRLYNWYAVSDPRGLAPVGWHIPTDAEWSTLISCLGGTFFTAGGKMKALTLWDDPNTGATNSSGFTALPGGSRYDFGPFGIRRYGYWWTSSEYSASNAYVRYLQYAESGLFGGSGNKINGYSVRCVKD